MGDVGCTPICVLDFVSGCFMRIWSPALESGFVFWEPIKELNCSGSRDRKNHFQSHRHVPSFTAAEDKIPSVRHLKALGVWISGFHFHSFIQGFMQHFFKETTQRCSRLQHGQKEQLSIDYRMCLKVS